MTHLSHYLYIHTYTYKFNRIVQIQLKSPNAFRDKQKLLFFMTQFDGIQNNKT